jgi:flavin reductase (DIM6/NTAB) family NADH-FMN oxidoreductase RutF
MAKREVGAMDYLPETLQSLASPGLLLVSVDRRGRPNAMTIGWGSVGVYWGKPIFVVPVRTSRYTHDCIERTRDFTVNVLPRKLAELATFCGTVSGREHDKFAEAQMTAERSRQVKSPTIAECVLSYECRLVHKNDLVPKALAKELLGPCYPKSDYHRFFFGEIVAARGADNLRRRL